MKNIKLFKTLKEYRSFIYKNVITQPEFQTTPFYKGLVEFVIDNRTPIFFEESAPYEKAHFTAFFNFELIRKGYENPYIRDLYFIHDFVHMVFDNPLNLKSFSLKEFSQIAIYNEYAASNETEIMTYYRLPSLRNKTFNFQIIFDFLKKEYSKKPSSKFLFNFRRNVIEKNTYGFLKDNKQAENSLKFLSKFKKNNSVWCRTWYEGFPKIELDYANKFISLPIADYERFLINYVPQKSEAKFKKNTLYNVRNAIKLSGFKKLPQNFKECFKAIKILENKIIMDHSARKFDVQYRAMN